MRHLIFFLPISRNCKVKRMIKSTAASITIKNSLSLRTPPWVMHHLAWSGTWSGRFIDGLLLSVLFPTSSFDLFCLVGKDQSEHLSTWGLQCGGITSPTYAKITKRQASVDSEVCVGVRVYIRMDFRNVIHCSKSVMTETCLFSQTAASSCTTAPITNTAGRSRGSWRRDDTALTVSWNRI